MKKPYVWDIRIEAKADDSLEIVVYDVIGKDWWTGEGVTAKSVLKALRDAPKAKAITLRINSVGGAVDDAKAIVNLLNERRADGAEVTAHVDGMAASAASYLTTVADRVVMPSNAFFMIHSASVVAWGNADKLRRAADVLDKVDGQLAEAYAAASARRGVEKSASDYRKEFAKGDLYLTAEEAIEWGLADEQTEELEVAAHRVDVSQLGSVPQALRNAPYVGKPDADVAVARDPSNYTYAKNDEAPPVAPKSEPEQIPTAANGGERISNSKKAKSMDLDLLKKEHPEVFAAAVKLGETQERDRVCGHLTMGESSGDMKTAIAAIQSGDAMTITLQAKYMSAAMNRADHSARQAESNAAGAAVDAAAAAAPVASAAPAQDLGDLVVAELKKQTL